MTSILFLFLLHVVYTRHCISPRLGTLRVKYSASSGFFFGCGEELVLVGRAGKSQTKARRVTTGRATPLFLLQLRLFCLLTSLNVSWCWLRAQASFLAEIFLLCAPISSRTGTNTYLKAVSTQQFPTSQEAKKETGGSQAYLPHFLPAALVLRGI